MIPALSKSQAQSLVYTAEGVAPLKLYPKPSLQKRFGGIRPGTAVSAAATAIAALGQTPTVRRPDRYSGGDGSAGEGYAHEALDPVCFSIDGMSLLEEREKERSLEGEGANERRRDLVRGRDISPVPSPGEIQEDEYFSHSMSATATTTTATYTDPYPVESHEPSNRAQQQPLLQPHTANMDHLREAVEFLGWFINRHIRVTTNTNRFFAGRLRCLDGERNLVLDSAHEYCAPLSSSSSSSSTSSLASSATTAESNCPVWNGTGRYLGMIVTPGKIITKIEYVP